MRYQKETDVIPVADDSPLPSPGRYGRAFFGIYIYWVAGIVLCLLPLLLLADIPLVSWGLIEGGAIWAWFFALDQMPNAKSASNEL
jgi:hypothetical protein